MVDEGNSIITVGHMGSLRKIILKKLVINEDNILMQEGELETDGVLVGTIKVKSGLVDFEEIGHKRG